MRFEELAKNGAISPPTAQAIAKMGFVEMSEVQALTFNPLLAGSDCIARAKTGTGKTVAFLLPTIEQIVSRKQPTASGTIQALIISPTRELAQQIQEEANQLIKFHGALSVQCVIGGTNIKADVRQITSRPPTILVATPGRLLDLMSNEGLAQRLGGLKFLILDECDRLLDAGFQKDLKAIIALLPDRGRCPRQGLLFSATISQEVREIAHLVLAKNHVSISTVKDSDESTHEHVDQHAAVVPIGDVFPALLDLLMREKAANAVNKIIVFFPTARSTQLASELFNVLGFQVEEIHSRKSQSARTKTSDRFRAAENGIMFSSDVSARGLDFPGVTLVIQVGVPSNREQYIHRLGRTGRAGGVGRGILVLSTAEAFFLPQISDLPLQQLAFGDLAGHRKTVNAALTRVDEQTKAQTYAAHLGFYKAFLRQMKISPAQLVQDSNSYAMDVLGCRSLPPILKKTAGKMGLKGVPGLNLVNSVDDGNYAPQSMHGVKHHPSSSSFQGQSAGGGGYRSSQQDSPGTGSPKRPRGDFNSRGGGPSRGGRGGRGRGRGRGGGASAHQ